MDPKEIPLGALHNGQVSILEPFYEKVTLYLDCPHGPEDKVNVYKYEIPTEVYCAWCNEHVAVESIETSEKIIFTEYI